MCLHTKCCIDTVLHSKNWRDSAKRKRSLCWGRRNWRNDSELKPRTVSIMRGTCRRWEGVVLMLSENEWMDSGGRNWERSECGIGRGHGLQTDGGTEWGVRREAVWIQTPQFGCCIQVRDWMIQVENTINVRVPGITPEALVVILRHIRRAATAEQNKKTSNG